MYEWLSLDVTQRLSSPGSGHSILSMALLANWLEEDRTRRDIDVSFFDGFGPLSGEDCSYATLLTSKASHRVYPERVRFCGFTAYGHDGYGN